MFDPAEPGWPLCVTLASRHKEQRGPRPQQPAPARSCEGAGRLGPGFEAQKRKGRKREAFRCWWRERGNGEERRSWEWLEIPRRVLGVRGPGLPRGTGSSPLRGPDGTQRPMPGWPLVLHQAGALVFQRPALQPHLITLLLPRAIAASLGWVQRQKHEMRGGGRHGQHRPDGG